MASKTLEILWPPWTPFAQGHQSHRCPSVPANTAQAGTAVRTSGQARVIDGPGLVLPTTRNLFIPNNPSYILQTNSWQTSLTQGL